MIFWYQLKINLADEKLAHIEAMLSENEAVLALTIQAQAEQEILLQPEPDVYPLWKKNTLVALFESEVSLLETIQALSLTPTEFEITILHQENWIEKSKHLFKPKQFGKRLYLHPSWEKPHQTAHNICLDPGMAFGTGEHETTTLCMQWLDQYFENQKRVLDFGSGSGILAIAAAKLGAAQVDAVDIDPQAVTVCRENAERNDVSEQIKAWHTAEFNITAPYDIVLANILARPLLELKKTFLSALDEKSMLVVSGLLAVQQDWITEVYAPELDLCNRFQLNNWLCLCFKKKSL